jgi:tRNA-2-methylthio-N6-dimethylallyladenosine synthase
MPDQIAPQVMDDRLARLQALVAEQQLAFNRATIGRTCEILIERNGKLPGQKLGKSPWLQSTLIDGGEIGDLVEVEIVSAGPQSLAGERPQRAAA